ncbi:MAG: lytic transglycosylase domain-containing protein [Sphingomicrobium sp.]
MMSSMRRLALLLPLLLPAASSASAQVSPAPYAYGYAPAASPAEINNALSDWRRLRQSSGYSFTDYARFLIGNPGWPAEATMRLNAEKAMRLGETPATVIAFFQNKPPTTGNGFAQLALSLAASGRSAEALNNAREAWASGDLGADEEQQLYTRLGGGLSWTEHDRRADALLFAKKPTEAQRFLPLTSGPRRANFTARIAMQLRWPDAETRFQAVTANTVADAGLLMDRLRYLRDGGNEQLARELAARPHNFTYRPEDPERFYEMLLAVAQGAASNRQYVNAFNIARQVDDAFPAGVDIGLKPLGIRDDYTSLTWLAGTMALDRISRPAEAIVLFDRYSRGGRSLQVQSKGLYWAGRAALAAGRPTVAATYFQRASAYPELFYGQLALERLGQPIPRPGPAPSFAVSGAQRAEFMNRRLVQATRSMLTYGSFAERELFNRALGESLKNDADRTLAVELAQQTGRPNLAVWVARTARINGSSFYVEAAFPHVPGNFGNLWSLSHGVTRQESSFDQAALSNAGARGMMQLMVPTAREQAGKMGLPFDSSRLVSDPAYNMQIGSAYFRWLLNYWDGSVPLAVASYNAGIGNVGKWVRTYGDPRNGTDVLKWIEAIPFTETKGYVQRVIENSVVYDSIDPAPANRSAMHVSRYLGKNRPG